MAKRIAEVLVDSLAEAGVRRIYGVAGDSLNGITDAIRRREDIAWVHVRHEEVAAFAAGAEAHLSGALAVCAGSCGPGNLHLINGLYDCHRSRVPVLAIYRTMTFEQALKDYPPKNDQERAALTQGFASGRAMLTKLQRDLLAGVPSARIVELPGANLYMFLSNEDDIIRELRTFAAALK